MRFKAQISAAFALLLVSGMAPSNAQETAAGIMVAAAQGARQPSAKQQCLNLCRTRYRACLARKEIPAPECRGVYQDCSRIACTHLRI